MSELHARALDRLEADGLVRRVAACHRTTRRWQGAMARAAFQLYGAGDDGADLRVPIATALVEIYGHAMADDDLASMVEAMLPIEAAEIDPKRHLASASTEPSGADRSSESS